MTNLEIRVSANKFSFNNPHSTTESTPKLKPTSPILHPSPVYLYIHRASASSKTCPSVLATTMFKATLAVVQTLETWSNFNDTDQIACMRCQALSQLLWSAVGPTGISYWGVHSTDKFCDWIRLGEGNLLLISLAGRGINRWWCARNAKRMIG